MRFMWFVLIGLLGAASLCLGAEDEMEAEVRLWVRATYTGVHKYETAGRHGGEQPSTQTHKSDDRLTLVITGTSIWRVKDWLPEPSTDNCMVSASGGGSFSKSDRGATGCVQHKGGKFLRLDRGSWTYSVPGKPTKALPTMSPLGTVMVMPDGNWRLMLLCYPNAEEAQQQGQWIHRYNSCEGQERTDEVIDGDREPPVEAAARSLAKVAFDETFGGTEQQVVDGTWDTSKKGFFASGRIENHGGDLNIPLAGGEGEQTFTGNEQRYWTSDTQYTISYNVKPPPVECIIEPDGGYDLWLPQGGADEQTVGNTLGVSAHLQVKGKPKATVLQKGKFIFQLVGESQEPGVALNLPLQGAKSEPDLKFGDSAGMKVTDGGKGCESTSKALQSASATLNCYDYGAYGKIRVVCQLDDGSVVHGHLAGQPGKEELSVPLDDDNNHVADSWERKEGVSGKAANWDGETEPSLDGLAGDGLSLYEEYRGLAHNGGIKRLTGLRKDLVVVNEMGPQAGPGLRLFQDGSGIRIVELSKGELPDDRMVNTNYGATAVIQQHGLRLARKTLKSGDIGESRPDRIKASPGDCDETVINTDLSFLPAGMLEALTAVGVAHEIGHSLGAQHHGDSWSGMMKEDLEINSPTTKIYDTQGREITERPRKLEGLTEEKMSAGESSGAQECVMRQSSFFQWVKHVDRLGALAYYAVPPTAPGTVFCGVSTGTGINAPDNAPISYFGEAAAGRGACLTHMRVSDH